MKHSIKSKISTFLNGLSKPTYIYYCSGARKYHTDFLRTSINYTDSNGFTHLTACIGFFDGNKLTKLEA